MRFQGGIFDVDGVLLDTPHEKTWRLALGQLMTGAWQDIAAQTTYQSGAFTSAVYQQYVAGKPRDAGAQAALAYFHIPDLDGSRAQQLADTKQVLIIEAAARGDFHSFDDALRFLLRAKADGLRVVAASSSKNARMFMQKVDVGAFCRANGLRYAFVAAATPLSAVFDADITDATIAHGKPDPEIFLTAAARLGLPPSTCFVVEDAPNGIEAARAGGMYAIGVARHDDMALLRDAQADSVVTSLDELKLADL